MNETTFAMLCYLVLMDHHGAGFIKAAPSHIEDKKYVMGMGWEAFAALDLNNMTRVIQYLKTWNVSPPLAIQTMYALNVEAAYKPVGHGH